MRALIETVYRDVSFFFFCGEKSVRRTTKQIV